MSAKAVAVEIPRMGSPPFRLKCSIQGHGLGGPETTITGHSRKGTNAIGEGFCILLLRVESARIVPAGGKRANLLRSQSQNSRRIWNAIMRGVLSPPNPTPSRPVGGEVVYVSAPKPVWVEGFPGMPASTMLGSPKFG
jgi:hypothetical protein